MTAHVNGKLIMADFPDPEHGANYFEQIELLKMKEIICEVA